MTDKQGLIDLIGSKLSHLYDSAQSIILFGSLASGDLSIDSDIDVLVISNSLDRSTIAKALQFFTEHYGIGYDIILFTMEEFKRNRHRKIIKEATSGGIVLWEKERTEES